MCVCVCVRVCKLASVASLSALGVPYKAWGKPQAVLLLRASPPQPPWAWESWAVWVNPTLCSAGGPHSIYCTALGLLWLPACMQQRGRTGAHMLVLLRTIKTPGKDLAVNLQRMHSAGTLFHLVVISDMVSGRNELRFIYDYKVEYTRSVTFAFVMFFL